MLMEQGNGFVKIITLKYIISLIYRMEIELFLNKGIDANASTFYDKIKKLKKKVKGADAMIIKSEKELALLEADKEKAVVEFKAKEKLKDIKREWYEKFRWFFSSEGFLLIGGRDATSNEIVVKKHTEKGDLIFHTDMIGSPFFVIKAEGKKVGQKTIREAADATVTFSRAFKLGVTTTPTFMARPDQLTKEAKSGEFVPKGGFVTKGKLEYIDNQINVALGNMDGHVMAGPVEAVKKHCKVYVELIQGTEKPGKVSKIIAHKLNVPIDDVSRALPTGTFKLVK